MRGRIDWASYLQEFHADRPGVTEQAFRHVAHPQLGTPYEWLTQGLPPSLGSVLDVASGNAALLPWLSGYDSYLGVDLSSAEIDLAHRQGRGPVVYGDARRLPVPDASVDTVVSSMGLMLVQPLEQAVAEVARVLRPGGTVGLLLPALWPVRVRDAPLGLLLSTLLTGPGSMPQQVSARRIRRLLAGVGLSTVETAWQRFPFPLRTAEHAALAVRALYVPGRHPQQLARAETALTRWVGGRAELPVPLLRVVARHT